MACLCDLLNKELQKKGGETRILGFNKGSNRMCFGCMPSSACCMYSKLILNFSLMHFEWLNPLFLWRAADCMLFCILLQYTKQFTYTHFGWQVLKWKKGHHMCQMELPADFWLHVSHSFIILTANLCTLTQENKYNHIWCCLSLINRFPK